MLMKNAVFMLTLNDVSQEEMSFTHFESHLHLSLYHLLIDTLRESVLVSIS